ncbi:MAG: DUF2848 family protein [Acidimicrobiia bacterium]
MKFLVGERVVSVEPQTVIAAGFTGRDREAVEAHLKELAALGVTVPDRIPSFYPVPASLAVQADRISVTHADTSGEAEVALVVAGGHTYVTVASDHTDRLAEASDIAMSKLMCPKVLAAEAWPLDEVAGHWDALELQSWIGTHGTTELYQEGRAEMLLPPAELLSLIPFQERLHSFIVLAGTLPAIGGIRPGDHFRARLYDPVLARSLSLSYTVGVLDHLVGEP